MNLSCLPPSSVQRGALLWMQLREQASGPLQHPTIRAFQCLELRQPPGDGDAAPCYTPGRLFWADTATGKLLTQPLPVLLDSPGGMLCDEPGLGKTITVVSGLAAALLHPLLHYLLPAAER
jgi:hypothetical protein